MIDSADQLVAAIRARKGRVTPQRRVILRHVQRLHGHFTAERLLAEVEPDLPGVSLPTVYATLDLLEDLGAVRRVAVPGGPALFDPRTDPHHHMVCSVCGRTEDVDAAVDLSAAERAAGAAGFDARHAEVLLRGVCARCSGAADRRTLRTSSAGQAGPPVITAAPRAGRRPRS